MKVDIGFWKMFGLAGLIGAELTQAMADKKISAKEAMRLVEKICGYLGIDMDKEGIDL